MQKVSERNFTNPFLRLLYHLFCVRIFSEEYNVIMLKYLPLAFFWCTGSADKLEIQNTILALRFYDHSTPRYTPVKT